MESFYNRPARSLLAVSSCTWKLQGDAPSEDGDAQESFQGKLLGLFPLISSEHSGCILWLDLEREWGEEV